MKQPHFKTQAEGARRAAVALSHPVERSQRKTRFRRDRHASRNNHELEQQLLLILRRCPRYSVRRNVAIPVSSEAQTLVRRTSGAYLGLSLPFDRSGEYVNAELLLVDEANGWAGAYGFCWAGSRSPRARRRLARDMRELELVLKSYMNAGGPSRIETVTVGIIDGAANACETDDLTISIEEISGHFDLPFTFSRRRSAFDARRTQAASRESLLGSCRLDHAASGDVP
jgi:hypothetical protein